MSLDDFEQTGCKVFKLTAGGHEKNYKLTPESVLSRWENIFQDKIKEFNIGKDSLKQMATEFVKECKKAMGWLKKQPDAGQYTIYHYLNPYSGEHITLQRFARFDQDGIKLEHESL